MTNKFKYDHTPERGNFFSNYLSEWNQIWQDASEHECPLGLRFVCESRMKWVKGSLFLICLFHLEKSLSNPTAIFGGNSFGSIGTTDVKLCSALAWATSEKAWPSSAPNPHFYLNIFFSIYNSHSKIGQGASERVGNLRVCSLSGSHWAGTWWYDTKHQSAQSPGTGFFDIKRRCASVTLEIFKSIHSLHFLPDEHDLVGWY